MCGRFYVPEKEMDEFARLVTEVERHLLKKYGDIYPGDTVPIITNAKGTREVHAIKWGFPSWKGKGLIINARSETAPVKPMFKAPFQRRRCLIPAAGFYEWKKEGQGDKIKKVKYFITYGNKLFYIAGLYWFFKDKEKEGLYPAFTILTTNANEKMRGIHDRMPVVIDESDMEKWLCAENPDDVIPLMAPNDYENMEISKSAS
ncbi:MAG: SOS response-associated peptidase [Clostridiaceae bacterium]|jgi:putative SOS response-associated peptidase YedK|nr:SOS response-associated peptidase [Clostridiaceae bacterium]